MQKKYQTNKGKIKEKYQNEKGKMKVKYQNEKTQRKQKYLQNKESKSKMNKQNAFKKHIREGPFFICVCCNRCLYSKSVQRISFGKYDFLLGRYCNIVPFFDGLFYICRTCHTSFKKKKKTMSISIKQIANFEFTCSISTEEIRKSSNC
jgi:hypothetical protein